MTPASQSGAPSPSDKPSDGTGQPRLTVGWVGLGGIGTQMVLRLLATDYDVAVSPRGQGLAEVSASGARVGAAPAAIAATCDILVLCVFSDAQIREVLLDGGALAAMRPGSIVALHTTGSPALARELGEVAPSGVAVLDATFSGGPAEAANGTLTLTVGGEAGAFERAQPVFARYARDIHHVGPLGHGQTIKLLNNLLFAANLRNAAEMLSLAERHGFAPAQVAQIVQTCSGASFAMGRFTSPRSLAAMLDSVRPYLVKDVGAAAASAAEAGLDISAFAPTIAYFRDPPG